MEAPLIPLEFDANDTMAIKMYFPGCNVTVCNTVLSPPPVGTGVVVSATEITLQRLLVN